jgi:hypothetical protein
VLLGGRCLQRQLNLLSTARRRGRNRQRIPIVVLDDRQETLPKRHHAGPIVKLGSHSVVGCVLNRCQINRLFGVIGGPAGAVADFASAEDFRIARRLAFSLDTPWVPRIRSRDCNRQQLSGATSRNCEHVKPERLDHLQSAIANLKSQMSLFP